tara:strand:+ start:1364 stop:1558 length:195 start_codon:yes stop_codon:yes gene_type:complete
MFDNRGFFSWRGGVNTYQIIIISVAFFVANNYLTDSGWGVLLKIIGFLFLFNLYRTVGWWIKGY